MAQVNSNFRRGLDSWLKRGGDQVSKFLDGQT
jgi:hypothetical protein